jgi:CheY-like chemotaxis protein
LCAGEKFDLAILDMQMPGMDGLMLAAEIRKLPTVAAMPLVLLTSMGVKSDTPEFAAASFSSCLTKPIKPIQLLEVLVRVVSGVKPISQMTTASAKLDPNLSTRLPLRVLLCDDNAINQKVAVRLLQQMGYKPDIAGNGVQALARIDAQPYDLVFMDVMMPEMDGLEATQQIRARQKDAITHPNYKAPIIIVAMTASAMQGDKEKCINAGMDDYLSKPVRLEDVRALIERWGSSLVCGDAVDTAQMNSVTVSVEAQEKPPVDMERLKELTDGTDSGMRELVNLYLDQTTKQLDDLQSAIKKQDAVEVRRIAHSCAGASATCGMNDIVPLLKEMEQQGFEGKLTGADQLCSGAIKEFARIRTFLAPYSRPSAKVAA